MDNSLNVFVIPSWYPSESNPTYGIFIKEEIELIAKHHPEVSIGISVWGQGNEELLLWGSKPFQSIIKVLMKKVTPEKKVLLTNCTEYHAPSFTWTRKVLRGNIRNIIKSNVENLKIFESEFGKVDIIHVSASYPGAIIAHFISQKFNIPYVITSHMSPFPFPDLLNGNGKIKNWLKIPIAKSGKIIASSTLAESRIREFGFKHTSVVPIARDLEFFTPSGNGDKKNRKVILSAGRLVEQKGFDVLLKAAALVESDFELRIAGAGILFSKLKSLESKLNLKHPIHWLGELGRDSLLDEMRSCDAFVLASRHETFGNVLVEAASCGKPIISTKCGGPQDIINDDIGILVDVEDESGLAKAIDKVLTTNPFKSSNIRHNICSRFSSERITDKIVGIYEDVVAGH